MLLAWLTATTLSGLPSTLHALVTGGDVTEATRAAGAMLVSRDSSLPQLVAAAAIVHSTISLFWVALLTLVLPRRRTLRWALIASALIAVVDLRIIAPTMFHDVARLPYWPQFADHLMWGACVGVTLAWRWSRRASRRA